MLDLPISDEIEPRQSEMAKCMKAKVSKNIIICMIAMSYTVGVVCICGYSDCGVS